MAFCKLLHLEMEMHHTVVITKLYVSTYKEKNWWFLYFLVLLLLGKDKGSHELHQATTAYGYFYSCWSDTKCQVRAKR